MADILAAFPDGFTQIYDFLMSSSWRGWWLIPLLVFAGIKVIEVLIHWAARDE